MYFWTTQANMTLTAKSTACDAIMHHCFGTGKKNEINQKQVFERFTKQKKYKIRLYANMTCMYDIVRLRQSAISGQAFFFG